MHPTASIVLANERIGDLYADARSGQLAARARRSGDQAAGTDGGPAVTPLVAWVRRLVGLIRPLPPAPAG